MKPSTHHITSWWTFFSVALTAAITSLAGRTDKESVALHKALTELHQGCFKGELFQDALAFAEQIHASPDIAIEFFNDNRLVPV